MTILSILKLTVLIALLIECVLLVIIEFTALIAVYRKYIKATDALMLTTMLIAVPTITSALYVLIMKIEGGIV